MNVKTYEECLILKLAPFGCFQPIIFPKQNQYRLSLRHQENFLTKASTYVTIYQGCFGS
jgi:hypothetical protein